MKHPGLFLSLLLAACAAPPPDREGPRMYVEFAKVPDYLLGDREFEADDEWAPTVGFEFPLWAPRPASRRRAVPPAPPLELEAHEPSVVVTECAHAGILSRMERLEAKEAELAERVEAATEAKTRTRWGALTALLGLAFASAASRYTGGGWSGWGHCKRLTSKAAKARARAILWPFSKKTKKGKTSCK